MLEVHGVQNVRRLNAGGSDQTVTVTDEADCLVGLDLTKTYGAKLTPEEARQIAKFLNQAANRVENS